MFQFVKTKHFVQSEMNFYLIYQKLRKKLIFGLTWNDSFQNSQPTKKIIIHTALFPWENEPFENLGQYEQWDNHSQLYQFGEEIAIPGTHSQSLAAWG